MIKINKATHLCMEALLGVLMYTLCEGKTLKVSDFVA